MQTHSSSRTQNLKAEVTPFWFLFSVCLCWFYSCLTNLTVWYTDLIKDDEIGRAWNSTDSKKVFYIQNKIIRIMAGTKGRASCRELFKKFNILPLASEFLLSLSFVMDNFETFQTNSDIHNISTRYRYNLHVPNTNLSKYQKRVYYSGIKLFSNLPPTIKSLNHDIKNLSQH
jgi:hypothetical protein